MVCATCRKTIGPGATYVRCTVASCNTGRAKLRFCSHSCWEKHVPTARHRNAGFVEERAGTAAAPGDAAPGDAPPGDVPPDDAA